MAVDGGRRGGVPRGPAKHMGRHACRPRDCGGARGTEDDRLPKSLEV